MKRILVTDTHLGHKKASDFYLELTFQLFEDIGSYAQEHGITELIHLGDFFDNRKNMSLKTLFYANRIGLNLKRFEKSYLIIGNHDLYYKDRYFPNSHQVFSSMRHIEVVDHPIEVGNMCLVPWIVEGEEFSSYRGVTCQEFLRDTQTEYCLGHWEINGAKMNVSGREAEGSDFGFSDFTKFKKTFSGHFHTPGEYPSNIQYLGASFHMDFNDSGPRGWYTFDDETGELEFVEWNKYPKFIKWVAKPDNVYGGEFKGQVVKIIFTEDYGTTINNQIIHDVQSTEPFQLFTEYRFTHVMSDDKISEDVQLMGPQEVHRDFIRNSEVPQHLSPALLEKIVDQIYEEINKQ